MKIAITSNGTVVCGFIGDDAEARCIGYCASNGIPVSGYQIITLQISQ
jgi:hypothetical protein